MRNKPIILDTEGNNCYKGDLIYYVILTKAGFYTVKYTYAENIKKNKDVWDTLLETDLVKSIFLHEEHANAICDDLNRDIRHDIKNLSKPPVFK